MMRRIAAAFAVLALTAGIAYGDVILGTNGPDAPYWSLKTTDDGSGNQIPNVAISGSVSGSTQGPTPDGQTATGNPVRVGGVYSVTEPTYGNGQIGTLQIGQRGSLQVQMMAPDSTSPLGTIGDTTDGVTTGTIFQKLQTAALLYGFNGTTWDRLRSDPTSMALNVNLVGGNGAVNQGSATSGQAGMLTQGAVTTSFPTYTTGTTAPLSLSTSGVLRVTPLSAAGSSPLGVSSGGAGPTVMEMIGGSYNAAPITVATGNAAAMQIDTTGSQYVNSEGRKRTYSASLSVAVAATATDVFTIYGSATAVVRIQRIEISGLATTAGGMVAQIIKRSAVNTGGTSTAMTAVPHDSNSAAATATGLGYTANPSGLGASVGAIRNIPLPFPLVANSIPPIAADFGSARGGQSIVLRGVAQGVAINLQGGTVPTGATLQVSFEWTEE
jgi:hypothetical protein